MKKSVFLLLLGAVLANAQQITSINFKGLIHLSPETAKEIMGLKVGDELSGDSTDRAITKLFKQGYFKADRIWNDPYLKKLEEADSRHQGHFNGRYFDTEDLVLQKNDIAYRVRQEGTKVVASLKWNGETNGALHCREELNVNLGNDADTSPVPSVFSESEVGQKMLTLIGDKPLVCIMEVNVLRRHMRVDIGKSLGRKFLGYCPSNDLFRLFLVWVEAFPSWLFDMHLELSRKKLQTKLEQNNPFFFTI